MSEVRFDEDDSLLARPALKQSEPPYFVRLVIKSGTAKTPKEAETILLILAGIAIVAAFFIYQLGKGHSHISGPVNIPLVTGARAP
ncbi:MAG: hypothetical protein JO026_00220 [Patescibacteria group bacterium]|nr:hypothetical protein [Patescibacteria group bacterium]